MPVYRNPINGPAGPAGKTVLTTSGAPSGGTGTDGDFAYDPTTNLMYGPKAGGTWPAGVSLKGVKGDTGNAGGTGPAGADGKTVLTTTGAPANGTGTNGDYAYDPAASLMYGPKASGAWPAGVSLKGAAGASGASGGGGGMLSPYSSLPLTPRAGRWYAFPPVGTAGTYALAINEPTTTLPFYVPATMTPVSVGIRVTTAAAAGNVRGNLYNVGDDREASTPFFDLGSVSAAATGARPFPNTTQLAAGWYSLVLMANGAAVTVAGFTASTAFVMPALAATAGTNGAGAHTAAGVTNSVSAAWPSPFTPTGTTATGFRFDIAF